MGRNTWHIDLGLLFTTVAITSIGLGILGTIDSGLFWSQFVYFVVGIALFVGISFVDPVILKWFAPAGYVLGIVFLLFSYLGPHIRGATRWIVLLGTQLQPSELVKPLMLLSYAFFITKFPPRNVKNIALLALLFLIPFVIILKQPDLGTGIVYFCFWLAMMIAGGLPLPLAGLGAIGAGLVAPLGWQFLAEYQKMRILTFLWPNADPGGAGYNALQSMIAVGSGQFFGRGLGLGTQSHLRFLPEHQTDFIFATLVEELGFVGGFMLFILYGYLLWHIIEPYVLRRRNSVFEYVFSFGLFAMLLSQVVINSGMNMGILPVTGITLPLVSSGGSSILSILTSLGLRQSLIGSKPEESAIAIDYKS